MRRKTRVTRAVRFLIRLLSGLFFVWASFKYKQLQQERTKLLQVKRLTMSVYDQSFSYADVDALWEELPSLLRIPFGPGRNDGHRLFRYSGENIYIPSEHLDSGEGRKDFYDPITPPKE